MMHSLGTLIRLQFGFQAVQTCSTLLRNFQPQVTCERRPILTLWCLTTYINVVSHS